MLICRNYLYYIGTREHVQKLTDDRPPTRKQEQLIAKLTKDFPGVKELDEYSDYAGCKTKASASALITMALEEHWSAVSQRDAYMKYIATRPHAERLTSHGLFGDEDNINLDVAMKIPPKHFRWYAAFHDEGEHPHVHMMAWSAKPGQAYLSREGIWQIKSQLTNDIFKQELLHIYEQKSESRDELVQEARESLLELTRQMQRGVCNHPDMEPLISGNGGLPVDVPLPGEGGLPRDPLRDTQSAPAHSKTRRVQVRQVSRFEAPRCQAIDKK